MNDPNETAGAAADPATRELIDHYRQSFKDSGATHGGVQWVSKESQYRRFRVLADVVGREDAVIDVGCGLAEWLVYARSERGYAGSYLGLDFVPEFIGHCRQRFRADRRARFETFDTRRDEFPSGGGVFIVSGTFNNLVTTVEENIHWRCRTIEKMYAAANKVVAFNALSTYGPHHAPGLVLTHPHEMLAWCAARITTRLTLRHDYNPPADQGLLADYTIYLYR